MNDDMRARVAAAKFTLNLAELHELRSELDAILESAKAAGIDPRTDRLWFDLLRDIALRAWCEVESVEGPTNAGRAMRAAKAEEK